MSWRRTSALAAPVADDRDLAEETTLSGSDKEACLEQILRAFCDIADRDDIHQAAKRLRLVQQWIDNEVARAAADPIFASFRLVRGKELSISIGRSPRSIATNIAGKPGT
jgi:hypothetical protein